MPELSEAKTAANAADASDAATEASGAVVEASDAPAEASNTADALAVVLEANLPTFVAGHTKIVGALRRCDKSWRDALGAHPATKRLFARCAACGKFAWRCSDCQGVAQPGEERRLLVGAQRVRRGEEPERLFVRRLGRRAKEELGGVALDKADCREPQARIRNCRCERPRVVLGAAYCPPL